MSYDALIKPSVMRIHDLVQDYLLDHISVCSRGGCVIRKNDPELHKKQFVQDHFLCRTVYPLQEDEHVGLLFSGINPKFDPGEATAMADFSQALAATEGFDYENHPFFSRMISFLEELGLRFRIPNDGGKKPDLPLLVFIDLLPIATNNVYTVRYLFRECPDLCDAVEKLFKTYCQYYLPEKVLSNGALAHWEFLPRIISAPVPSGPIASRVFTYDGHHTTVISTSVSIRVPTIRGEIKWSRIKNSLGAALRGE